MFSLRNVPSRLWEQGQPGDLDWSGGKVIRVLVALFDSSFQLDAAQGLSWNEQCECWIPAVFEFSKLFKCDDEVGAGMRRRQPTPRPTSSSSISISIISPQQGATLQGDSVTVRLALVAAAEHAHTNAITVDFVFNGLTVAQGIHHPSNDFSFVLKDLKPGPHVAEARAILQGGIIARQSLTFSIALLASNASESSSGSYALPQPGRGSTRDAANAEGGALYYTAADADDGVSVALCLVGEARRSTFEAIDGKRPVSGGAAKLDWRAWCAIVCVSHLASSAASSSLKSPDHLTASSPGA